MVQSVHDQHAAIPGGRQSGRQSVGAERFVSHSQSISPPVKQKARRLMVWLVKSFVSHSVIGSVIR